LPFERPKKAHDVTHPQVSTDPLFPSAEREGVDPQFVELFIEEAKEEIASVQQFFPMWDQNPMDFESLGVLRRSFHTLKAAAGWSARGPSPNSAGPSRTC